MSSHDEQDDVDDGDDEEEGDELLVVAPVHQAELLGQRVLDTLRHWLRLGRRGRNQPLADAEIHTTSFESGFTYVLVSLLRDLCEIQANFGVSF